MGILSRLFSRQELATAEELEKILASIQKNSQSHYVALVGLKGKVKGLEVVTVQDKKVEVDEREFRRYAAKLAELYLRLSSLELVPRDRAPAPVFLRVYYTEDLDFYVLPVGGTEGFIVIALGSTETRLVKYLQKNQARLEELIAQLGKK